MKLENILNPADIKNEQQFLSGDMPEAWMTSEERKREQWLKIRCNQAHHSIRYIKAFHPDETDTLNGLNEQLVRLRQEMHELHVAQSKRLLIQTNLKIMALTANYNNQKCRLERLLEIQRRLERIVASDTPKVVGQATRPAVSLQRTRS